MIICLFVLDFEIINVLITMRNFLTKINVLEQKNAYRCKNLLQSVDFTCFICYRGAYVSGFGHAYSCAEKACGKGFCINCLEILNKF